MDDELIFTEEVAAMLGTSVGGVRQAQRRARAARAKGETGPHLLPEPVDRVTRTRPARGHDRTVIDSPRWSRAAIESYKINRRGPGGRSHETEAVASNG
jgi:hypothetical protein